MIVTQNRSDLEYLKKAWWSVSRSVIYVVAFSVMAFGIFLEFLIGVLNYAVTGEGFGFVISGMLIFGFCLYFLIRVCRMPHRMMKKLNSISPDVVETMTFGENGFSANNNGPGLSEHVEYGYDRVTKAFYSDRWFVIICDSSRIYPIRANSFREGDPRQLAALLTAKLGKRYRVK